MCSVEWLWRVCLVYNQDAGTYIARSLATCRSCHVEPGSIAWGFITNIMKFKAIFTDTGLGLLEKGADSLDPMPAARIQFVYSSFECVHRLTIAGWSAALEKHGKGCHLLLGRDKVYLIQTTLEADGMLVVAQLDVVSSLHLFTTKHASR